jgi:uncharacterized membrane protein
MNNLITLYVLNKKQNIFLIFSSIIALVLLLIRVKITHSFYLLFLIWNLILAIIPYVISNFIKIDFSLKNYNFKNLFFIVSWLLFLPNTFYLITDFVHLHHNNLMQFCFDFILLSCFTIAGFYFGILSIFSIQQQIQFFYTSKISYLFTISISFLCAFGIYIGRFLRFNSWDIISYPIFLAESTFNCLFEIETWTFTLGLGILITIVNLIYIKSKSNI